MCVSDENDSAAKWRFITPKTGMYPNFYSVLLAREYGFRGYG